VIGLRVLIREKISRLKMCGNNYLFILVSKIKLVFGI